MFEVLLAAKPVRSPRPLVETALSALVHTVIIAVIAGGSAVATNDQAREKFEGFLQYLFPPDRAAKAGDEHIAFVGVGQVGTPKGEVRGEPVKVEKDVLTESAIVPQLATQTAELSGVMQLAAQAQAVGAFSIVDVDSAAERDPMSAAPTYPKDLLTKNVEGYATLRFVVDSTGLIDLSTIKLVESTHPLFVKAVEDAMPRMRFRPAMMGHNAVRQLAEQLFKFEIKKPAPGGLSAKP